MAAMTTALTEFTRYGDSITYTLSGHTAAKPQLVIQKRRVPAGNQVVAESTVSVVLATTNAAGEVVSQKVAFTATCRYPIDGQQADIDSALATFRDVIAGDEFANTVNTQEPLI